MRFSKKVRQDWAPILFFGVVVAVKTYHLIFYLTRSQNLWGLLGNINRLEDFGPAAAFFLTGSLSYILYLRALRKVPEKVSPCKVSGNMARRHRVSN